MRIPLYQVEFPKDGVRLYAESVVDSYPFMSSLLESSETPIKILNGPRFAYPSGTNRSDPNPSDEGVDACRQHHRPIDLTTWFCSDWGGQGRGDMSIYLINHLRIPGDIPNEEGL